MAPRKRDQRKRVSKRKAGKRMMVRRSPGIRQPVHYFKRSAYVTNSVSVTAGTTFLAGVNFQLDGVLNNSEFTALYDQYKILGIKIRWLPRGNSSDLVSQGQISRFGSVIDYDDSATPSSFDQLSQYQNFKLTNTNQIHQRYFRPKVNLGTILQTTGVASARSSMRSTWIDVADTTVPHYGVKIAVQPPASGTITFDTHVTYYLAFKNVR